MLFNSKSWGGLIALCLDNIAVFQSMRASNVMKSNGVSMNSKGVSVQICNFYEDHSSANVRNPFRNLHCNLQRNCRKHPTTLVRSRAWLRQIQLKPYKMRVLIAFVGFVLCKCFGDLAVCRGMVWEPLCHGFVGGHDFHIWVNIGGPSFRQISSSKIRSQGFRTTEPGVAGMLRFFWRRCVALVRIMLVLFVSFRVYLLAFYVLSTSFVFSVCCCFDRRGRGGLCTRAIAQASSGVILFSTQSRRVSAIFF